MTGRLIGVVGPSGVGKDTVMQALSEVVPDLLLVRRVITRDPKLGGEDFEAVDPAEFDRREAAGAFCLSWEAHGLHYGIPDGVRLKVGMGSDMLVNLSRTALEPAAQIFPNFVVLNIIASPQTLKQRLAARGREDAEEISRRLARRVVAPPEGIEMITVSNDGPIEDTVLKILEALQRKVTPFERQSMRKPRPPHDQSMDH